MPTLANELTVALYALSKRHWTPGHVKAHPRTGGGRFGNRTDQSGQRAFNWNEDDHPRAEEGTSEGGQFTKKESESSKALQPKRVNITKPGYEGVYERRLNGPRLEWFNIATPQAMPLPDSTIRKWKDEGHAADPQQSSEPSKNSENATPTTTTAELAAHRQSLFGRLDKFLDARNDIPQEIRTKWRGWVEQIVLYMGPHSVKYFNQHIRSWCLFPTNDELAAHFTRIQKETLPRGARLAGFCGWGEPGEGGRLYLNGGAPAAGGNDAYTENESGRGTWAHEMAHGIDGRRGNALSDTAAWKAAWKEEIEESFSAPSEYSRTNSCEGFAEFGRLLFSGLRHRYIKQEYPRCYRFWKERNLI